MYELLEAYAVPLAVGLIVACGATAAAIAGQSRLRFALSMAVALASFAVPFVPPSSASFVRFLIALCSFLFAVRAWDVYTDRSKQTLPRRLWFFFTPFDTRKTERAAPAVRPHQVVGAVLWSAITAAAFGSVATWLPYTDEPTGLLARWCVGLVGCYGMAEAVNYVTTLVYALVGVRIPILHRTPIAARTVAEFWGERWNLEVNRILRQRAFMPLARGRRPTLAIAAGFAGSVLIHVWIMIPSGGWALAAVWGGFFALHGAFVLAERALSVAKWRRPLARAWTLLLFGVSSPLFVEPFMRITVG